VDLVEWESRIEIREGLGDVVLGRKGCVFDAGLEICERATEEVERGNRWKEGREEGKGRESVSHSRRRIESNDEQVVEVVWEKERVCGVLTSLGVSRSVGSVGAEDDLIEEEPSVEGWGRVGRGRGSLGEEGSEEGGG